MADDTNINNLAGYSSSATVLTVDDGTVVSIGEYCLTEGGELMEVVEGLSRNGLN